VPLVSEASATPKIVTIVTQSDLLQFIFSHEDEILPFIPTQNQSVFALGMVQSFIKLSPSTTVAAALKKMLSQKKSSGTDDPAVAVIEPESGILVGELSARHLRSLSVHNFQSVYHPIAEWKSCTGKAVSVEVQKATVREVMRLMVEGLSDRVWIVDQEGVPVGIVRAVDLMQHLVKPY